MAIEHVLRVQDDSGDLYDIAEQRTDGTWVVAVNDEDVLTALQSVIDTITDSATSGASTEAKQDANIAVLNQIKAVIATNIQAGDEVALDAATLTALESIAISNLPATYPNQHAQGITDAQLRASEIEVNDDASQAILTEIKDAIEGQTTDGLTDAQLRSTAVPVTISGGLQTDGITDSQLRATDVEVSDDAAQALLTTLVGALGDTVTADTVRELLLRIYEAVDGLEFSVDQLELTAEQINLNTDDLEAKLDTLAATDFSTETTLEAARVLIASIDTELAQQQTDALTDAELRATPVPVSGTVTATGTQTDGLTDAELRASDVEVNDSGTQDLLTLIESKLPSGSRHDIESSTEIPLLSGETFTGPWTLADGIGGLSFFAYSAGTGLTTAWLEWSDDGITAATDLLAVTNYLSSEDADSPGFWVYFPDPQMYVQRRYYRIVLGNDSGVDQTILSANLWTFPVGSAPFTFGDLDGQLGSLSKALLTRSVSVAFTPAGTFANVPLGGKDPNNSLSQYLAASDPLNGDVIDLVGQNSMLVLVLATSELDTCKWQWYTDEATASVDPFIPSTTLDEFNVNGFYVYITLLSTMNDRYGRLEVINNADAATQVNTYVWLYPEGYAGTFQNPGTAMGAFDLAQTTVSTLQGQDDLDAFKSIGVDGALGKSSLNSYITNLPINDSEDGINVDVITMPDLDLAPSNRGLSGQLNITQTPRQLPIPSGFTPLSVAIFNMSAPDDGGDPPISGPHVFIASDEASTADRGYDLPPQHSYIEDNAGTADDQIWLMTGAASGVGGTTQDDLFADTVDSASGGITNPTNVYATNGSYATLNATGQIMSVSGFDSTLISETSVVSVSINIRARKEAASTQQVTWVNTVQGLATGGGTSITSNTVGLSTTDLYLVSVSRRATDAAVNNITNTMGFTGSELVMVSNNGNESRTNVYRMTGTPTSTGAITINMNNNMDYGAMSVTRFSGVDMSDPIQAFVESENSNGQTPSWSLAGTNKGLSYIAMGTEITDYNTTAGYTQRLKIGSTTNNDQRHVILTKQLTSTGTEAVSTTLTTSGDYSSVAVTLRPAQSISPIVTLSHNNGSKTISETLSNDTFTDFSLLLDEPAVTWTKALIDSGVLTITATSVGLADIYVDSVWYEIQSASSTARISYRWRGRAL